MWLLEGPFSHDLSGSLGFEPYFNFSSKMKNFLEERGKDILEEFTEKSRKEGIESATFLDTGIVSNEISSRAKIMDLVIISQRGLNAEFERGLLGSTTEAVTRKCIKPVLVTPKNFKEPFNFLLCYDGSQHANDAMQSAADFVSYLNMPLTVLIVFKSEADGNKLLSNAQRYLSTYKVKSDFKALKGNPHEEIVKFAGRNSVDIIFMGAYGHSRIIEMVLGSTTEYVLRNVSCSVLMCK